MTLSNLEKIFGPDVEDPIDIDNDPDDGDSVEVVGVHNNLLIEQSRVVTTSGCGRYEGEGRSYQDRMFVTLSFSDPELTASHFISPPHPKRAQSAPPLQGSIESQSPIQSKIVNCWSRSRSEDHLGSSRCQTGTVSEMSSYIQNDGTNFSDFTSVFTNETEPTLLPGQIEEEEEEEGLDGTNLSDFSSVFSFTNETEPNLPTLPPGQIEKEEEEEDLDEETTGAFFIEKTVNDNKNYKTRKRTWWKKICLLCMSKQ